MTRGREGRREEEDKFHRSNKLLKKNSSTQVLKHL
jgi:hypothetical protein